MNKMFSRLSSARGSLDSSPSPEPGAFDILCGKDKTYNSHVPNRKFREMIASFQDEYSRAASKQDKMNITKAIVQKLQSEYGARFVKLHKGQWQEINDQMARDKVSHALRFAAKGCPKSCKAKAPRALRRSDKTSSLTSSVTESSVTSSTSSASSSASSVSSHHDRHESGVGDEDAMVDSLFERQRLILKTFRFDDHLEEEIGVSCKRRSIIDKAIFFQRKSDAALIAIPETVPPRQPFHEFDTLKSEDFDILLNDPMDFNTSQEWALDMAR